MTATDMIQPDLARLAVCANAIAAAGRKLGAQGLTPATSSNFSMRLDAALIAVTVSGRDKGALSADDVMVVDLHGNPVATFGFNQVDDLSGVFFLFGQVVNGNVSAFTSIGDSDRATNPGVSAGNQRFFAGQAAMSFVAFFPVVGYGLHF